MKLSQALRAIAERSSYSSEQERDDVLAALDREADRIDGDSPDVTEDVVTLTPAGVAATSSPAKRPGAKKTTPRTARRKPAGAVGG